MGGILLTIGIILFIICVIIGLASYETKFLISSLIGVIISIVLITIGAVIDYNTPESYLVSEYIEYTNETDSFYRIRLFNEETDKVEFFYLYPEQLEKYKIEEGGTVELSKNQLSNFMKKED